MLSSTMSKAEMSGEILNNTGSMEHHQGSRQLSLSFRDMKIKRAEKKGADSVLDDKFSLLFQAQFSVGEVVFQVCHCLQCSWQPGASCLAHSLLG